MAVDKRDLLLLFDRPREPIFTEKVIKDEKVIFDLPVNYLTDRYRQIGPIITEQFGGNADRKISIGDFNPPNLRIPMSLRRDEPFSLFIPQHRKIAGHLIDIFMSAKPLEGFLNIAVFSRDRVNPNLFNYALSVALMHRADTRNLNIPTLAKYFPEKFFNSRIFIQIREEAAIAPIEYRMPVMIPKDSTALDLDPEHKLWYFREDMGINLHHWHWHLVYPFDASDRKIVNKDRRGELFYYMHQQILARYNFERFSNNLQRVMRLENLRDTIKAGYYPKLNNSAGHRAYPGRGKNTKISDINRADDQLKLNVDDMERWRERICTAIRQGFVTDETGNRVQLDDVTGIDILGNIMESANISVNRYYYGDFHNMGHVLLSYVHDPDNRFKESYSVIGDPATAMRDPAFYTFHALIDDLFQEHKETLIPYTVQQLNFRGITISGVGTQTDDGKVNTLQTFWQQSDVDLSRGMEFTSPGEVFARFTHLQHKAFTYKITANNDGGELRSGTVRIFLGPKFDEEGKEMFFRDQRLFMIEMDRFVVVLRPGENVIFRKSCDSALTLTFERTFRNFDSKCLEKKDSEEEQFNYCGCGWPEHMLVPKGLPQGLECDLFVMISNNDYDQVHNNIVGVCQDASTFCGIRDRLYPDRRPMGYPFDRLARPGTDRLSNFITTNMFVEKVKIVHTDSTILRV